MSPTTQFMAIDFTDWKILRCNFGATNKILRRKLITSKGCWWHRSFFFLSSFALRFLRTRKNSKKLKKSLDHLLWSFCFCLFYRATACLLHAFRILSREVFEGGKYSASMNCLEFLINRKCLDKQPWMSSVGWIKTKYKDFKVSITR